MSDIRVERQYGCVEIYDRLGGLGHITLREDEAEFVRDRIDEVLDDE